MNAFELKNLTKHYNGFALEDVTLALPSGCILGLIGENGAGKSTTIKLMLGMERADGGSVQLLGQEGAQCSREALGVVMDEAGMPGSLTACMVGKVLSNIYGQWDGARFAQLLERLSVPQDRAFKDLSRGMKMKLGIAAALSHGAQLLVLDEATNGLDPVAREEVLELLTDFTRSEEHSVLLSSHIVSDLEKICDYVAFLHKGRLMAFAEKDRLLEQYGLLNGTQRELERVPQEAVVSCRYSPYGVQAIVRADAVPAELTLERLSLEDLFVGMVKEEEA